MVTLNVNPIDFQTLMNVVRFTMEGNGGSDILNCSLNCVGKIEDTKLFMDVPNFPVSESFSALPLVSYTAVTA